MKKVFSNSREVFHLWAAQAQSEARSGSVSFNGPVLRSYQAEIGRLIKTATGETWAIHSARRYSNTTAKHEGYARQAARHLKSVTIDPLGSWGNQGTLPSSPAVILGQLLLPLRSLEEEFNAKKVATSRIGALRRYGMQQETILGFCAAFGLPVPEFRPLATPEMLANLEARAKEIEAKQEEKRRIRDAANQRRWEAQRAAYEKRAAEERALAALSSEERVAKWLSGESSFLRHGDTPETLMRLQPGTPDRVETSLGAVVSLRDAVRLFRLCEVCKNAARELKPATRTAVGPYELALIDAAGNAQVGCHSLTFGQMKRLADSLGAEVLAKFEKEAGK